MSLDHFLDDADPRDAAEAAIIMANATVGDAAASEAERSDARELIELGVDELERRFQEDEAEELTRGVEDGGRKADIGITDGEALFRKYAAKRVYLPSAGLLISLGLHKSWGTTDDLAAFTVSGLDVVALPGGDSASDVRSEGNAREGSTESSD